MVATRWAQSYAAGVAAPVRLAATNLRAVELVPRPWLEEHAVDVPEDPRDLG